MVSRIPPLHLMQTPKGQRPHTWLMDGPSVQGSFRHSCDYNHYIYTQAPYSTVVISFVFPLSQYGPYIYIYIYVYIWYVPCYDVVVSIFFPLPVYHPKILCIPYYSIVVSIFVSMRGLLWDAEGICRGKSSAWRVRKLSKYRVSGLGSRGPSK